MPRLPIGQLVDSISTNLLNRVQQQDERAWQRLVDLYAPLVYRWCRRWGVRADDAADIVQEVFRRVTAAVEQFQRKSPGDTFRGWLWRIARNATTDQVYRQARQPAGVGGTDQQGKLQQIPEELPSAEPEFADEPLRLMRQVVDQVRNDFQPRTWDIFWRSAVLGHSAAEIAREYQLTAKAVRQAKHRVLTRLREQGRGVVEL